MTRPRVESLEGRWLLSFATTGDVNVRPAPSLGNVAAAGGVAFFAHDDGTHGTEVWKADGTAGGTALLMDVRPGPDGSAPSNFGAVGPAVFFTVDDGVGGQQLWRSEGTPESTRLVRQFDAAPEGVNLSNLIDVDGVGFFAVDGFNRRVLWKSDGTAAGTVPVRAVPRAGTPPQGASVLYGLNVGGTLYFRGYTNSSGRDQEVWKSDGTEAGTVLVADLYSSADVYWPTDFAALGNQLLFTHEFFSPDLWATDGTPGGTRRVKDLGFSVEGLTDLTTFDGRVYFRTRHSQWVTAGAGRVGVSSPLPVSRSDLWSTDGTEDGTRLVVTTAPGEDDFFSGEIEVSGSSLYYTAWGGRQLWRIAGAGAEPVLVLTDNGYGRKMHGLVDVGGTLHFFDRENSGPERLFKLVGDFAVPLSFSQPPQTGVALSYAPVAVSGGRLFVDVQIRHDLNEHPYDDRELWSAAKDGSEFTRAAAPKAGTLSSWPLGLAVANGRVFFDAHDRSRGNAPDFWASDGTAEGTRKLAFLGPIYGRGAAAMGAAGDVMIFTVFSLAGSNVLWRSDGTPAGTYALVPQSRGRTVDGVGNGVVMGGRVYFSAGAELWRTDGTHEGTERVAPLGSTAVYPMVAAGGTVFFKVDGWLWKSDGTAAGTAAVKAVGSARDFYAAGDAVYFTVENYPAPPALWRSDGTEGGTGPVAASMAGEYVAAAGTLFFRRVTADGRPQLWRTDGTEAGTRLVREFEALGRSSDFGRGRMRAVGDVLLFSAADARHGWELWKSDGTAEGTVMVRDIAPGPGSSNPQPLGVDAGVLAFSADDLTHGQEIWRSDGTAGGTQLLDDVRPGRRGSDPSAAVWAGGTLYVSATMDATGVEVFALRPRVTNRQVFYAGSRGGAGGGEDRGRDVAEDKVALLPGESAVLRNVTHFSGGLNGLVIDIRSARGVGGGASADDFEFRVGARGDSGGWSPAPAPESVVVERGAGARGADRVVITWPDGAIRNTWLEVVAKAGGRTGLDRDDVFYFGNLVGETGPGSTDFRVNASDVALTRAHFGSSRPEALRRFDFDRNGKVDAADVLAVRSGMSQTLPVLRAPDASPPAGRTAAGAMGTASARARVPTRRSAFALDQ